MCVLVPFQLNGYKIKEGWQINVNISIPKSRLYIGSIPKTKTKEEIKEEFEKHTSKFQLHCMVR